MCRSGASAASPKPLALADDALVAECTRRGMAVTPPPPPLDAPPLVEHSASSISAKSKEKDEASKKLDKLIDLHLDAEKTLSKLHDEVAAAAIASQKAETAFMDEVAATHQILVPEADTTAINIGAFIENIHDLSKLKVDFGSDLHFEGLGAHDSTVLQGKVDTMVKDIAQHIHAAFMPLKEILDKAETMIAEAIGTAAKKRKTEDGSVAAAPASRPSPLPPLPLQRRLRPLRRTRPPLTRKLLTPLLQPPPPRRKPRKLE